MWGILNKPEESLIEEKQTEEEKQNEESMQTDGEQPSTSTAADKEEEKVCYGLRLAIYGTNSVTLSSLKDAQIFSRSSGLRILVINKFHTFMNSQNLIKT